MENLLGIRRRIAASISFGLFVAPRTKILVSFPVARPSHNLLRSRFAQPGVRAGLKKKTHVMNSAFLCPHSIISWGSQR